MKFVEKRPFANPHAAARKLAEIAKATSALPEVPPPQVILQRERPG
jgi:hypothetical protein